jgi:hypothetical protein
MEFGIQPYEQQDGQRYEAWIEASTGEKLSSSAIN